MGPLKILPVFTLRYLCLQTVSHLSPSPFPPLPNPIAAQDLLHQQLSQTLTITHVLGASPASCAFAYHQLIPITGLWQDPAVTKYTLTVKAPTAAWAHIQLYISSHWPILPGLLIGFMGLLRIYRIYAFLRSHWRERGRERGRTLI